VLEGSHCARRPSGYNHSNYLIFSRLDYINITLLRLFTHPILDTLGVPSLDVAWSRSFFTDFKTPFRDQLFASR